MQSKKDGQDKKRLTPLYPHYPKNKKKSFFHL